ncbi:cysteine-rich receptor-like protein kinase 15 [Miscanthus floridulus]|uniref:cysteine-rich receptor-like protein kinase 15 n=1 Tax=Miscanthus floridulus TaxID=154761 RepID=UPI00345B0F99
MRMQSLVFLITAVLLILLTATADEVTTEFIPLYYTCSEDGGRYGENSTYLSNLKVLAGLLSANASTANFVSGTAGQAPDAVYGFVLCRGDYTGATCRNSLYKAFHNAVDKGFLCRFYKDVTIYYDDYMLRFSGDDVRRNLTNRPAWVALNMNSVTRVAGKNYGEKVEKLTKMIVEVAASSPGRYGTGKAWVGGNDVSTAYGLLHHESSDYYVGGRILGPRCNLRYEKELFFQETNATLLIDMPKNHLGKIEIILITIAAVLLIIILITLLGWIIQWKADSKIRNELEEWTRLVAVDIGTMFTHFTLSEIRSATDNFSEAKKLGEGAFGPVYWGQLASGVVAIKRLAAYSSQGLEQFRNEIRFIAKLQHLNLVKLIGCCMQQKEKILIYEYMPNRSLDDIFKDVAKWASLTWPLRQNIIDGIAQGLLYIHNFSQSETCIVHRDLKASNILLDHQMNPKISDFGIAMLSSSATESQDTVPMGTLGYMAPECFHGSSISVKSDVFSFGVLILEIISGRKVATSFRRYKRSDNLMAYAWRLWEDGNCKQLIDNSLSVEEHNRESEIIRCIQIALLCVQANPEDRPDMVEVVRMLSIKGTQLHNPKQPAYFDELIVATTSNHTSTRYLTAMHVHPA